MSTTARIERPPKRSQFKHSRSQRVQKVRQYVCRPRYKRGRHLLSPGLSSLPSLSRSFSLSLSFRTTIDSTTKSPPRLVAMSRHPSLSCALPCSISLSLSHTHSLPPSLRSVSLLSRPPSPSPLHFCWLPSPPTPVGRRATAAARTETPITLLAVGLRVSLQRKITPVN